METLICKGVVSGHTVILEKDASLPEGAEVVVSSVDMKPGSPQAILAAAQASPHLKPGDVEELLRLIDEGKRPVRCDNPLTRNQRKNGE